MKSLTNPEEIRSKLKHWASSKPNEIACIGSSSSLTWSELYSSIDSISTSIITQYGESIRLEDTPTIGILLDNSVEFLITTYAISISGAAYELLPYDLSIDQLDSVISNSGLKLIVTDGKFIDQFKSSVPVFVKYDQLAPVSDSDLTAKPFKPVAGVFSVVYSSGTSGLPKAIVHSYDARLAVCRQGEALGIDDNAVNLVVLPMYNNLALIGWFSSVWNGARNVILNKPDEANIPEQVERNKITAFLATPTEYRKLLKNYHSNIQKLQSLEVHICSSSRMSCEEKKQIAQNIPGRFYEIYGVTEGGVGTILDCSGLEKFHTVGQPMGMYDMKIINAEGDPVDAGEIGRIVGSSDFMMTGYKDKTLTANFWQNPTSRELRYFIPGDLGYFDSDGYLVVLDRMEDTVLLGEDRVFPSTIEASIHDSCEDVDVMVTFDKDFDSNNKVHIWWVGIQTEATVIKGVMKASYPALTQYVLHKCDSLPRNRMGKLLRHSARTNNEAIYE